MTFQSTRDCHESDCRYAADRGLASSSSNRSSSLQKCFLGARYYIILTGAVVVPRLEGGGLKNSDVGNRCYCGLDPVSPLHCGWFLVDTNMALLPEVLPCTES